MASFFKPFGLQSRNTTLDSIREENVRLRQSTSVTSIRSSSNVSTVSRTFGVRPESIHSINTQNNSMFNQDVRNNRSSFMPTSFGLQMRSLTTMRDTPSNNSSRFNQDSHITNYRSKEQFQTSNTSRIFGPAFRNTTLTNSLQIQERSIDETESGGFRVPTVPRLIRGRNPITSSRIFSHQSIDKCKNLSNINGFDVSHLSRRDADTMSESRLGLMRSGWLDKQSVSGSIYSTNSVKAQAMNLLENLHYSILNMGSYITVDAVTMEIEKAKQGLDSICEMSFAPSVREADAVSIISQSSKFNCPAVNDQTRSIINGECLNLKSSKEVLKSLTISNTEVRTKLNLNQTEKKSTINQSTQNMELDLEQEESCLVFKKPKSFMKDKKSSQSLKIRTDQMALLPYRDNGQCPVWPPVKKSLASKVISRIINLKQWYPIAIGDDLALCGTNEQGVITRTEAVKKRINNRKVELINGLSCNLIGSPSSMASALPKNIAFLIRNGLTPRWRVLQKKLLNCQTVEGEKQKRISKSPGGTKTPPKKTKSPKRKEKPTKRKSKTPSERGSPIKLRSPHKATAKTLPESGSEQKNHRTKVERKKLNTLKANLTSLKKIITEERTSNKKNYPSRAKSSPKKKGNDVRTRSGRTVKPPSLFWIGKGSSEKPSLELSVSEIAVSETPIVKQTKTTKKTKKTDSAFSRETCNESCIVNSTVGIEESNKKLKAVGFTKKKLEKPQKAKQEQGSKKEMLQVVNVDSSTPRTRAKRKREPNAEVESTQRKKSKVAGFEEIEVESTVTETRATKNNVKQKKTSVAKGTPSPKSKGIQSKKKKNTSSKKKVMKSLSANVTETKYAREIEEDFEFQLDDIEIPQFGNLNGNPQLSRSQLRLVSAETPPLKYFNSNLKVLRSATPMRSPEWVVSQRTESEVKQFQKRRAEAFKKKVELKKTEFKKTVVTGKSQSRDLKKVLEWVAEKTVQSPQWGSKALQYVLPSRRRLEQQEDEEEEEHEEDESEFV